MPKQLEAEHNIYSVCRMGKHIVFGKGQNQLVYIYNCDTDCKHVKRRHTSMD